MKCSRCARKNLPCIPRKPGKPSPHQKPTTACDACAKVKQACKFAPFTEAREDEVKVKIPKPEKPQSKRAARVIKSAPEVQTSAGEEEEKPKPAKIKAPTSVDRDRPHTGRPLSKAIQKANAALKKVAPMSAGQKPASGRRVSFGLTELYKNLSREAMTAVIRLEEEDDREREAMSRALIFRRAYGAEGEDEGVNGAAQATGLQMQDVSSKRSIRSRVTLMMSSSDARTNTTAQKRCSNSAVQEVGMGKVRMVY